jgi:type VI secretion system protein ImpE
VDALKLLNQGLLDEALESAKNMVRERPTEIDAREVLAELLCLKGEMERADKQLETIVLQQPQSSITAVLVRQLIRAETARRECWSEGRVPEFVGAPDAICEQSLAAAVAMRAGEHSRALQIIEAIEEQRSAISGKCNSQAFSDFRDLDDSCLAIMEVLTSTGKYFWIPISRIQSMEFSPVARPRDLLWRQCQMRVEDGPDGVVYIPALYQRTRTSSDPAALLGSSTDWLVEDDHPILGIGQRVFAMGDVELGIMEIKTLEFGAPL